MHVILEEPPEVTKPEAAIERPVQILALSARSNEALNEIARGVAECLESQTPDVLADVCFTANAGRSHFSQRVTVLGKNTEEVLIGLRAFANREATAHVLAGDIIDLRSPLVAFLFTGQGSQYIGMGRALYETSPTFRRVMDRCDEILRPHLEKPLLSVLYPKAGDVRLLDQTAYTQPALFAIEYALAELWRSWGVHPTFVMGHSVGEYVAACVAGVFGLEDGLRLIAERGRLMQSLPAGGRMSAVFAGPERVKTALVSVERGFHCLNQWSGDRRDLRRRESNRGRSQATFHGGNQEQGPGRFTRVSFAIDGHGPGFVREGRDHH